MAARRVSPERSGNPAARCRSSGVWFHINLPPQMPFGVRPELRMCSRQAVDDAVSGVPGSSGSSSRRIVEQPQNRVVLDSGEPLPRLRRHTGRRQVLEELLRLAGTARRAQRLDQQRAAAALRSEHEVRRRMRGHHVSLAGCHGGRFHTEYVQAEHNYCSTCLTPSSIPRSTAIADRLVGVFSWICRYVSV